MGGPYSRLPPAGPGFVGGAGEPLDGIAGARHCLTPPSMVPSFSTIALTALGALAYLAAIYLVDRSLAGTPRAYFRYVAVALSVGVFFFGVGKIVPDADREIGVKKAGIALAAAAALFYEQARVGMRRPISERWKRPVGIVLGLAAIVAYYHGFRFNYPKYYHRHDQYHYYLGAKYFPELGYDDLYKCTVIAQDQLGTIKEVDSGRMVDLVHENHRADRKIRNLGADNLLKPAAEFLEHPEECTERFTPERWAAFKEDIRFFRSVSDREFWERMQADHGYNPPPVWMLAGNFFANLYPAGHEMGGFVWLQWLAQLDNVLILGMFAALWWAFGWRVFAVAAVYWGCNAPGDDYFVSGAFLRQDWLFFFVLAACLARKRYFALSGASLVYAGLLRIFPGLAVIGWLVVAGAYIVRHKRMAKHHQRMLLGGVLAAALLIPASIRLCKWEAYPNFARHTLQVHNETPLTNHMGLRVLISHKVGTGPESGRAMYTKDDKLPDPFEVWKRMRNERYYKYRPIAWVVIAASLAFFIWVVRRIKSMWIALCLGQIFIILLSQLTSYYYAFMVITAPLTKARRQIELPLLGLAAVSQLVWGAFGWFDDKSAAVTLIDLVFCFGLIAMFMSREQTEKVMAIFSRFRGTKAEAKA